MKQAHYGGPWAPTWSSSSLRLPEFTLVAGLGLGTKSLLARGTRPVGVGVGLRPCWLCCPQYPAHAGMRWALAGIWAGGGVLSCQKLSLQGACGERSLQNHPGTCLGGLLPGGAHSMRLSQGRAAGASLVGRSWGLLAESPVAGSSGRE